MKAFHLFFSMIFIPCMFFAQQGEDRSFKKGDQLCEAGFGLALFYHNDLRYQDTTEHDSAGSFIFPVRYTYALLNWLGVGGMFRFHNFIEGDSSGNAQAIGYDLGLRADMHFLRTRRLDFSGALGFGFTHLDWKAHDGGNLHAYGSGTHFDIELITRFYFSDHFGMYFQYGRIFQNLPNIIGENDFGAREEYDFKLRGGQFAIGIQVKL